jgi:hypothetical protein
MITAIVAGLALTVLASEALGQPGGRGRGGQGWGYGPGWGRGMTGGPQMNADLDSAQPDNSWKPGPYCPFGQDPNQNIQDWRGRGPGGYGQGFQGPRGPYCPLGQGPNQNFQGWQGRGPRGYGRNMQGRGPRGFSQGFQGPRGPYCPFGQGPNQNIRGRQGRGPGRFGLGRQGRGLGPQSRWGFGRGNMMMQRRPMAGRGVRGPAFQGRAGRGFQRGYMSGQDWGMNGRWGQAGPGGPGIQNPNTQPQGTTPGDTGRINQPTPPRGRGWASGWGPGWRRNWTPDWNLGLQSEKAPDANAPAAEPPVKDQTEQPQQPQEE